jgi:hypothetical protein
MFTPSPLKRDEREPLGHLAVPAQVHHHRRHDHGLARRRGSLLRGTEPAVKLDRSHGASSTASTRPSGVERSGFSVLVDSIRIRPHGERGDASMWKSSVTRSRSGPSARPWPGTSRATWWRSRVGRGADLHVLAQPALQGAVYALHAREPTPTKESPNRYASLLSRFSTGEPKEGLTMRKTLRWHMRRPS